MKFPFSYEATISRADFARLLPVATNEPEIRCINGEFCGTGWRIRLTPLPSLAVGLFRLERHRVEIFLDRLSAEAQDRFMLQFTQCYQRGGG